MAYLTERPPVRDQWYAERRRPLTGCTVLHSSEGVMDTIGPDTGAEALAEFIRTRTTAGSYHDVADSDTGLQLVEYHHGAFHDGTGSNNWALSISFALRTIDWARMTPERRRGFLWQGALRFVAQQQYRKRTGAPLTRLRYITKAQSDAGESGFCCHGWRDPSRRTDPGTTTTAQFPFDEWLAVCAQALAQHMPDHPDASPEEIDMTALYEARGSDGRNLFDSIIQTRSELKDRATEALFDTRVQGRNVFDWFVQASIDRAQAEAREAARDAALLEVVRAKGAPDPEVVATAVTQATERALANADFPTAEQIAAATLAAQERAELESLRRRVAELEAMGGPATGPAT